jgi:hypothetical protein
VKATKIGLLLLILGFGGVVETAWTVRHHIDIGPMGCRVLGGRFYGPSFTFTEETRQPLAENTALEIENSFGSVQVGSGGAGEVAITLRKVVYLPGEEKARTFASAIRLDAAASGAAVRIVTNREQREREEPGIGFETHLDVRVPEGTKVSVVNAHGRVEVTATGETSVENSYDTVRVDSIKGTATVRARHGDVHVGRAPGTVSVVARHGDVTVEDAEGRVDVSVEHGSATLARVGAAVVEASFGDVTAEAVRGDLEVRGRHSEARVSDVTGAAAVTTSYNDVRVEKVGGAARIKTEHGGIHAAQVKGGVVAESTYNGVELESIGGLAEVTVSHGGVQARGLESGIRVKSSGDEVTLDGVRGAVTVEADRGDVHIKPAGPVTDPVSVSTKHGSITVEIPAGSRFALEASTSRGELDVDVPGLEMKQVKPTRVEGVLGTGGNAMKLFADTGDVTVSTATAAASKD